MIFNAFQVSFDSYLTSFLMLGGERDTRGMIRCVSYLVYHSFCGFENSIVTIQQHVVKFRFKILPDAQRYLLVTPSLRRGHKN